MQRPDVKRDAKTMEGFAIALKKQLNDHAGGIPFFREIDYADFRAFVHGDDMQALLDEHVDTFETVKQKMEVPSAHASAPDTEP